MLERKFKEISEEHARRIYPEIYEAGNIPGNHKEARAIFASLKKKPKRFKVSLRVEGYGWCDIYETAEGKIAVYSDGNINAAPMYVVKL